MIDPTVVERRLAAAYDAFHRARSRTTITHDLCAQAMGDDYPADVAPSSSCDLPLLQLMTERLALQPYQHLVDLGCGTGGTGLWLARATGAAVRGVDISPEAIRLARARLPDFAPAFGEFQVGSVRYTGLSYGRAHGLVCVDALGPAGDRGAALHEGAGSCSPGPVP
ncbi:methyltransferase domain-containing protein [Kitasatospora sp. NPDC059599]|uniref:methyltransferase domain-containing protein n=1 Tax=Kitasatospora sp. NPDC059599 TaxID=3346880 RepID=UPI0036D05CED